MRDEDYTEDDMMWWQVQDEEHEMWESDRVERANDMIEECKKWEL